MYICIYVYYIFHDLYYILGSSSYKWIHFAFFFRVISQRANSPWFFRHKSSPEAAGFPVKIFPNFPGARPTSLKNWSFSLFAAGRNAARKRAGQIIEVNEGFSMIFHVAGGYQNVLIIEYTKIYSYIANYFNFSSRTSVSGMVVR